jgi:hypothetical protein
MFTVPRPAATTMATVAVLLLMSSPPAWAYRPFAGTDAGVAAVNKLEVEFGPMGYSRFGEERLLIAPELELTYGAGSGWEFAMEARGLTRMSPDPDAVKPTIDDIQLEVGRLLRAGSLQDKHGLSMLVEGDLLVPSTTRQRLGAGLLLAGSQAWQDAALHLSGGISKTPDRDSARFASLIAEGPDRWEVRPVAEASLEGEVGGTTLQSLLMGFIWQTKTGLAMDFAFRKGYSDQRLAEYRSGITWNRHVSGPRIP